MNSRVNKIAVIGSGISGLSIARMLHQEYEVTVFEQADKIGGLVKCDRIQDNLYHRVGGHVFNSRNQRVLDWFWSHFDRDNEFLKARRNAKILMDGRIIGYPLENYLYQLDASFVSVVLDELLALQNEKNNVQYLNFEAFLKANFGNTLYNLYFGPYNRKIWNTDLAQVPLDWLDGKLPMPNLKEMLLSNIIRQEEANMVHATFYYARENGSQFIANRLAEGLTILLNTAVHCVEKKGGSLVINHQMAFDKVIYCGDVRRLLQVYQHAAPGLTAAFNSVIRLKSSGTSTLFCETDATDISWLYLPELHLKAHRIIYTGTFSPSNSRGSQRSTCVVEFSGMYSYEEMCQEIKKLPGNLSPISYNYEPNSYVIQDTDTREKIHNLKQLTEEDGLYLLGRFAEWEYYNMDKAIEAAFAVKEKFMTSQMHT